MQDNLTPLYPPLTQLLRVTATTVPGPTGYASNSILAPNLYVAFTQQLRTATVLPRDREPCLVSDINRLGLQEGYYLGRLAGSHNALPVYEVAEFPGWAVGLSSGQTHTLTTQLTQTQLQTLGGLDSPQLQTLLGTLDTPQLQTLLSTGINSAQLQNLLVTVPTTGQSLLKSILTSLTTPQLLNLATNVTREQLTGLLRALTLAELRIMAGLTTARLQALLFQPVPAIAVLLRNLALAGLNEFLDINPAPPAPVLGAQNQFPMIPVIDGEPSSAPVVPEGYTGLVADEDGNLYTGGDGGIWDQIAGGGGGAPSTPGSQYRHWLPPIRLTYANFSTAATSNAIILYVPSAREIISGVVIKTNLRFTGGAITNYRLFVGYTGTTYADYIDNYDAFVAASDTHDMIDVCTNVDMMVQMAFTAIFASVIFIRATTNVFLNSATQGEVDVWLETSTLPLS